MKVEMHLKAFEERKETLFKWAIAVRGIENSQRSIGDNASKAIVELLSAYFHKNKIVEQGFQLNHSWFKSPRVTERLPDFPRKQEIIERMVSLELLCEKLSYGTEQQLERIQEVLNLFKQLENEIQSLLKQ